jgi:hypothetical protein
MNVREIDPPRPCEKELYLRTVGGVLKFVACGDPATRVVRGPRELEIAVCDQCLDHIGRCFVVDDE